MPNSKIAAVATYLPERRVSVANVAQAVRNESPQLDLPIEMYLSKLVGVEYVYRRADGQNTSDLAAAAGERALARAGLSITDVDLLIFSSASQDLVEPATSHIVSALLGARGLPVFDVKNACNSVLNGIEVADALIRGGRYKSVLIVSGESPSIAVRWANKDAAQFLRSFPGLSMSDAGAAVVMVATDNPREGVVDIAFTADSDRWSVGTLPGGGSRHPRDLEMSYFDIDGTKLAETFQALGPDIILEILKRNQRTWDDFAAIGMHQVAGPYINQICELLSVPSDRVIRTIGDYGNMTSCTFPLQLEIALERGMVTTGDEFAYIGLAGGISVGMGIFRL